MGLGGLATLRSLVSMLVTGVSVCHAAPESVLVTGVSVCRTAPESVVCHTSPESEPVTGVSVCHVAPESVPPPRVHPLSVRNRLSCTAPEKACFPCVPPSERVR